MEQTTTIGTEFARAFADKDAGRLRDLLHPEIDFRGLTPSRNWEAGDAESVIAILLGTWLEESDEVRALESVETGTVADRQRVGYRIAVRNPEGDFVFEQQVYVGERDGRIDWMRVVCSGFRPVA